MSNAEQIEYWNGKVGDTWVMMQERMDLALTPVTAALLAAAAPQAGELVLSGMPDRRLAISVSRITPVAVQRDGRNVFEVEASIAGGPPPGLRPGMEGVGKVVVGERSLLWIWTHGFFDWLRLALWSWTP